MARRPRIEIAGYYHIINREESESGDNNKSIKPTLYSSKKIKGQVNAIVNNKLKGIL